MYTSDDDQPGKGLAALVYDPDRSWCRILEMELRRMGFSHIFLAKTAEECLLMIKGHQPDILLVHRDLKLIRFIRTHKSSPSPTLPIVLMSAVLGVNEIIEDRDAGVDEILAKPASANTFRKHVVEVLTHRREFIRANVYLGPDRRRRTDRHFPGADRRDED